MPRPAEDLGLPDSLVQLSFSVQEILASVAAAHDLSLPQLRLLGILRDREPTMLELAAALKLEKSSVTGLVERAERRGLVLRARSERDARAVHVRLTPRGRDLARRGAQQIERRLADLLGPLSHRERTSLSRTATRVVG